MSFTERGGWWVVAQVALFAAILTTAWGLGPDTVDLWLQIAGFVLFGLGAALSGAGALPLGSRLSPFPAPTSRAELRTDGVFGLVRHPIYGGVILVFMGIAVRSASALAVILATGLLPFFVAKSRYEEKLLEQRFPEYADYRERVTRRFVPWVM